MRRERKSEKGRKGPGGNSEINHSRVRHRDTKAKVEWK